MPKASRLGSQLTTGFECPFDGRRQITQCRKAGRSRAWPHALCGPARGQDVVHAYPRWGTSNLASGHNDGDRIWGPHSNGRNGEGSALPAKIARGSDQVTRNLAMLPAHPTLSGEISASRASPGPIPTWNPGRRLGLLASVFAMTLATPTFAQTIATPAKLEDHPERGVTMKGASALASDLLTRRDSEQAQGDLAGASSTDAENGAAPPAQTNDRIEVVLTGAVVADASYSGSDGTGSYFGGAQFLPILLVGYGDQLLVETHMEITTDSDGETETSLEYAQVNYLVNDWLTVVAGKFLSPIGQYQQALHAPWINKLPTAPAGFTEEGGASPMTETGLMVRGGFKIGAGTATYAAFVGNGPRLGELGPMLEGFGGDDNRNKAIGGRVSYLPTPDFEIGLSAMRARILGMPAMAGDVSQATYSLVGADFAYTGGYWDIRGEYLRSRLGEINSAKEPTDPMPTTIPRTKWEAWYGQVAYRLAGISSNKVIANFEPAIRYSRISVSGYSEFADVQEQRWSFGIAYWMKPAVVAKVAYEIADFPSAPSAKRLNLQLTFGF